MLFQTWTFVVFFSIFYPVYLALKKTRFRTAWLLVGSCAFFSGWNPAYLSLIFYLALVDYLAAVGMSRTRWKKSWLVLSLVNSLGLLGCFKYGMFVTDNLNALLAWLGAPYALATPDVSFVFDFVNGTLIWLLNLPCRLVDYLLFGPVLASWRIPPIPSFPALSSALPLGMSFYVFRSLSYTIDSYRGDCEEEPSFIRYVTFVSLFPQFLAGPIDRARDLLPQLRRTPKITGQDVADGLSLFVVGLFKKVALADYLALYVGQIYGSPADFQAPALILATFAFAWQIYFDFSGYTDMARGVGRMLGLRLMLNFNNPYLATGLGDFWRRWHISLSTWFRDYVYIPLGGSRKGEIRTYVNMALTMIVSGLWHGAMWTFVIWGALHALGYSITRALERTPFYEQRVPRPVKQLCTFLFVSFAWIFFRADSLGDAWLIVTRIFTSGWSDPLCPLLLLALVLCVWLYQFAYESKVRRVLALAPVRVGLVVLMLLYVALISGAGDQPFYYMQF